MRSSSCTTANLCQDVGDSDQISSRSKLLDEMTNRLDANSKQVQRGEEKEGRGRRKVGKGGGEGQRNERMKDSFMHE